MSRPSFHRRLGRWHQQVGRYASYSPLIDKPSQTFHNCPIHMFVIHININTKSNNNVPYNSCWLIFKVMKMGQFWTIVASVAKIHLQRQPDKWQERKSNRRAVEKDWGNTQKGREKRERLLTNYTARSILVYVLGLSQSYCMHTFLWHCARRGLYV